MSSLIPSSHRASGMLSRKAKAKMNNAINWMIYLSEGKSYYNKKTKQSYKLHINFITLTLSAKQMHSDSFVQEKMLRPFLKWMKRKGNSLYVWRAETQFNGNIHFHITSNKYLHWESIRNKWNNIQSKHGYISAYSLNNDDGIPNSTDVHGVKDITYMASYMTKYMGKNSDEQFSARYLPLSERPLLDFIIGDFRVDKNGNTISIRRNVRCKVWSCSTELMNKRLTITEEDEGFSTIAEEMNTRCTSKQFEQIRIFLYPSKLFRNGLIQYTDEQLSRNDVKREKGSRE